MRENWGEMTDDQWFRLQEFGVELSGLIDKYKDLGKELDGDLNLPNGFKVHIEPATKDTDE
jgi:hypothetical protein